MRIAVGLGVVVGLTVGLGTVVTGSHWPSDIAGGLLLGVAGLVIGLAVAARSLVARIGLSAVRRTLDT